MTDEEKLRAYVSDPQKIIGKSKKQLYADYAKWLCEGGQNVRPVSYAEYIQIVGSMYSGRLERT